MPATLVVAVRSRGAAHVHPGRREEHGKVDDRDVEKSRKPQGKYYLAEAEAGNSGKILFDHIEFL